MPSQSTKFGRDVVIAAAATALKSLRSFLWLPILTRALSPEAYGLWELTVVGITLAIPWITLQLPGALVRFLPGTDDRRDLQQIFYSIFFTAAGTSSFCAAALWLISPALNGVALAEPFLPHAGVIVALLPLTAMLNTAVALFRATRLMIRHSALTLAQSFGEIGAVSYVLATSSGIGEALAALLIVRTAVLLAALGLVAFTIGVARPKFASMGEYLKYSIPLIPNSSFYQLFDAGDRFVISYYLGMATVGLYAAAYTAGSFLTTLIAPLNLVLLPLMAELWNKDQLDSLREYVTDAIRYTAMLAIPAVCGTFVLADELFSVLTPGAYSEAVPFFPLLALSFSVFSIGILGGNLLVVAGQTRLVSALYGSLAAANFVLNLLLVPVYGVAGAVAATLISHAAYTVVSILRSRAVVGYSFPVAHLLKAALSSLAMSVTVGYVTPELPLPATVLLAIAVYAASMVLLRGITAREVHFAIRLIRG